MNNEEILLLVDLWQQAKNKIQRKNLSNQIVSSLSFLVHSRIKGYQNFSIYEDLFQEGCLGILRALNDFDFNRGKNFFILAIWHIKTRVRRFLLREAKKYTPIDFLSQDGFIINNELEMREEYSTIIKALNFLPDKDRRVLTMRFGFNGEEPCTFQHIGNVLGISKQRAQQIEANALRRLRNNCNIQQVF